ncbi:DUF3108 domain-containing protein [Phytohalomonas tamaricis]|uniref:DUF3108 domain-containing protein n=1 Tax=Phytohalomonas tamaricis TaxID=2081032 RepID=UPI000D0BE9FE|nr:DUF3108 domain-containing protein [Phytohalomonas tamaricis]
MRRLTISLIALLLSSSAWANDLVPFQASYHLKAGDWPQAVVEHTLEVQDGVWKSTMFASIKIATGREYGRFRVRDEHLQPIDYYSRYRLFGFGDDYHLDANAMAALPDRQTALVALGRTIDTVSCTGTANPPCELRYLDHKKKPHTMRYRIRGREQITVPAGQWQTLHVELWDEKKPKRCFHFYVSPRYPGLLIKVNYFKNGELDSHMEMAAFTAG